MNNWLQQSYHEKFIMTIGSTRPMEDAARIAYREFTNW
jgi:amidase